MTRYRTISVKMWGDDRFSRLSRPNPCGQFLWIYLLTGPHTTVFPLAFVAGEAGLAEALNWSLASFRKAFREVLKEGLLEADPQHRIVFIPKGIRHNPPQSPNVVTAWRKVFNELPECAMKERIFNHAIAELQAMNKDEAFVKAFGEAFTYALGESVPVPVPVPEQKGSSPIVPLLSFGEFGMAKFTAEQYAKLEERLNGSLAGFIEQFDLWVHESPDVKDSSGIRRRDRHAYESILSWHQRALSEGKIKSNISGKMPAKPKAVY